MAIKLVKVRASIEIGNDLIVVTPFIQSFNVRKSRGQLSSFDASLKVEYSQISGTNVGGSVVIKAGADGTLNKIYTGIIKKSTMSPCWDDPGYVLLNISGTDVLSHLQGKKYTRRCRATKSNWISINGVTRRGLRDGRFEADFQVLKTDPGSTTKEKQQINAPALPTAQSTFTSPSEVPILISINLNSVPDEVS